MTRGRRAHPPVGRDAALLAAMLTLSSICQLNMAVAIPRLLPIVRHRPERIVWGAYLLTAAVSILGAIAFVLVAPAGLTVAVKITGPPSKRDRPAELVTVVVVAVVP